MARKKRTSRRKKSFPSPSITGLASGLLVAQYINAGDKANGTVIQALQAGEIDSAVNRLAKYGPALITNKKGQSTLVKAVGIAVLGQAVKKMFKGVKLGTQKLHLTI